jgi:hypothetical protein
VTRKIIGQYFFFFFATAMCWVLIGQTIQYNMTTKTLTKVDGIIDTTIEVGKRKYKSRKKTYELRIFLQDTSEYFRFMDIYKYRTFRDQIYKGDTAEIFIRPKWLVPLGMGHRNDIFQLTINGKTIFDISQTRKNSGGIIIVAIIAIPLFVFLGKYIRRKK